jgi:hypothetical protein
MTGIGTPNNHNRIPRPMTYSLSTRPKQTIKQDATQTTEAENEPEARARQ